MLTDPAQSLPNLSEVLALKESLASKLETDLDHKVLRLVDQRLAEALYSKMPKEVRCNLVEELREVLVAMGTGGTGKRHLDTREREHMEGSHGNDFFEEDVYGDEVVEEFGCGELEVGQVEKW